METGVRGFALTGFEPFLQPYASGQRTLASDVAKLSRLVTPTPVQTERLAVLSDLVSRQQSTARNLVNERRQSGKPPSESVLLKSEQGTDAIRAVVQAIDLEERRLLDERIQRSLRTRQVTSFAIALGSLLGIVFFYAASVLLRREIAIAAKAQEQVRSLNVALEERVAFRTSALVEESATRRSMQTRLRSSEERFRALVAGISDYAIYMLDNEGCVASWNSGAARITGFAEEEIIGQHVACFSPATGSNRQHIQNALRQATLTGRSEEEALRVRKDGSTFWSHAVITALRDEQGVLIGFSEIMRDITERKQAQAELQEKEYLLSQSQRIAHIGSWTFQLDDHERRLVWSEEMYRIYGVSPESFSPTVEGLIQRIWPEDRAASRRWLAACEAGEDPADLEFRLAMPDGTLRTYNRRGELQFDAVGRPVRMTGTTQDITERKRVETTLRESEERFEAVANGIPQLAWITDPGGGRVWYNQRWYDHTGTTFEEVRGWGWQKVLHPDIAGEVVKRWKGAVAAGEIFDMEFPIRGADGVFRTFLTRGMPFKDAQGRVIRWFGTNTDISERKRSEERLATQATELARSRQDMETQTLCLQSILNSLGEGVVAADEQGRFILWNPAATRIIGHGPADLPPEAWSGHFGAFLPDMVTPFPAEQNPLVRALGGEVSSAVIYIRNPNQSSGVWIESNGAPLHDQHGNSRGGVIAFRDISQRKADEWEIRKLNDDLEDKIALRTAQLQTANQELQAFTYSVSHDLRSPLRHISGFSRILISDFGPSMVPEARVHLQRIEEAVARMGLLVDGLLSLARLGRQALTVQSVSLKAIVEQVVAMLQPEREGRAVEWQIADLPELEGDRTLLVQVFQNLLSNALKYSRDRAKTVIEIGHLQCAGDPTVIFVRDNGVGFNMQYAGKLFEVFHRMHTQAEFEGSGVGLATVYRIIQKHGGRVWAEAETDRGATFFFTLGLPQRQTPVEGHHKADLPQ